MNLATKRRLQRAGKISMRPRDVRGVLGENYRGMRWPGDLGSEEIDCLAEANDATATLDAIINTQAKVWQPTGIFEPEELKVLVDSVVALLNNARAAVLAAPNFTSDAQQMKNEALLDIGRKLTDSVRFYTAIAVATGSHAQVRADDIKPFIIRAAASASNALTVAAVLQCRFNAMVGFLLSFQGQFELVAFAMKTTVGHIVDVARQVVKVAKGVSTVIDAVIKLTVVGVVGWFAWSLWKDRKRR